MDTGCVDFDLFVFGFDINEEVDITDDVLDDEEEFPAFLHIFLIEL